MPAINGTMMQYFHWYYPADGSLWGKVAGESSALADLGITALWLPPAYKGTSPQDVGYGPYDLYDLGEFDQKGGVPTKYGTKEQYLAAVDAAHRAGIQIYADVVFNHRAGADGTEWVKAVRVWKDNRLDAFQSDFKDFWVEVYTDFRFPGRGDKYSPFKWDWTCFDGVDYAVNRPREPNVIYKFQQRDKDWASMVNNENGNYDYLMFSDIDMNDADIRTELGRWGLWYLQTTGVDGFRLDAVKHIQYSFFWYWLEQMQRQKKEIFAVGEYWNPNNIQDLHDYITGTNGCMSLFDAPLHRNFYEASRAGGYYDMRQILNRTLMSEQPTLAVTLVDNHDTQPCQALESWVDYWFKPLAYAIILLRAQGYPCVFYPDLYGAAYDARKDVHIDLQPVQKLRELLAARKTYAYGTQRDYFDHPDIVGWTREGDDDHPGSGLAVILSDGPGGSKWMEVGLRHANRLFVDHLGNATGQVRINGDGWGEFYCSGGSVSAWRPQ